MLLSPEIDKRIKIGVIALVFPFWCIAQHQLFNIQQATLGQWREFYPKSFNNLQWRGNSNQFTFQDYETLFAQRVSKPDTLVVMKFSELNQYLKAFHHDTLTHFPIITWADDENFHFYHNQYWYNYNVKKAQFTDTLNLPLNAEHKTLHYATKQIAFTIDQNLFIGSSNGIGQITFDTTGQIVSGQSVSRNEFGINSGIFWAENGKALAFYQKDESNVLSYPLVDITSREATCEPIKYPMAGMKSEQVCVGVYHLDTKSCVYIERDDQKSEKYLTNLTWNPESNAIYLQVLNREQNHLLLNAYDAENGKLNKTLFEEKHPKYVEPLNPLTFINSNQFIYLSRTSGYNHAYLYNTDGTLEKQLTQGNWEILQIIKADQHNLYYVSTQQSPLERHFYRLNIRNLATTVLTSNPGTHSIKISDDATKFIDVYESMDVPYVVDVFGTDGKLIRNVLNAPNPYQRFTMPKAQIGTIKAADNKTDLYYRLILPPQFDSTKQYPCVVYVYGGPHDQLVTNDWLGGARLWEYYMAQKGYVMFTLDNRGSANRGLEFENVIHRQCGVNEMADQLQGIKLLESLKFVDMNQIGVHGWSYGGFMAISLMVNYPDIFKVGVAGGPVIDWKYYEIMYGERYMDSPSENPQGYAFTSLLPRARDLKGRLMIIHGGIDPTVVWQHSQLFLQECIKNQIPIDYFVYPTAEHNVRGFDRVHLMDKVTRYFDDFLIK